LTNALEGVWRGWEFWTVTTVGRFAPNEVAENWSVVDVFETHFALQIKGLLA